MKKRWIAFAAALTLLLSACAATAAPKTETTTVPETTAAVAAQTQPSAATPAETTAAAPKTDGLLSKFTATDLDGNPIDQSVFAGHKVTMLNIWATFCGPCLNEMPELGELSAEYADKGVQIIGLAEDTLTSKGEIDKDQVELAKELVKSTKANYLHILPSQDLTEKILFKVQAVPTTYFFDENGERIGEIMVGSKSKADWAAVLDGLLAKQG